MTVDVVTKDNHRGCLERIVEAFPSSSVVFKSCRHLLYVVINTFIQVGEAVRE